jgi:transposase InsO family protein
MFGEAQAMGAVLSALLAGFATLFRSRLALQLEILALRHQLTIYERTVKRPRIRPADRMFWSWLSRRWAKWREALVFVQPATVISWQRKRFRDHWARLSGARKAGRPRISEEVRELIRTISSANPLWGTPRIVGELGKLGIEVAKSTVDKYHVRSRNAPSPTWKAFLKSHLNELVSIDFLVVPTIRFKLLYVLIVLAHSRRKVLHFNVTSHPTALWTAQQLVEAFPWDSAPKYLLRDRDAIYGGEFRKRIHAMGIEQVLSAPRSPWQNPFVERLIGTLRRDCLDHVVALNERHLRRMIARYLDYYHDWRTQLSLSMDAPNPRVVHPPDRGRVVAFPELGGLHHHYERLAA